MRREVGQPVRAALLAQLVEHPLLPPQRLQPRRALRVVGLVLRLEQRRPRRDVRPHAVVEDLRLAQAAVGAGAVEHQPQAVARHVRERLLEPREHREQPAHVGRAHRRAAVVDRRDHAGRLALYDHVRLHEPLLVKQAGEAVEDAQVVRRHRPRRIDPLPVVQHAIGVVDRRQPPQPLAHTQPAVRQKLGHAVRAVGRGSAVNVAATHVAEQPMHPLQHVLVLLRHDSRLERREVGRLRLNELPKRPIGKRHGQRRHEPLQHGVRLADGDGVAHRQEAAAACAPQRLALARLTVDRATLERPLSRHRRVRRRRCRWCGRLLLRGGRQLSHQ